MFHTAVSQILVPIAHCNYSHDYSIGKWESDLFLWAFMLHMRICRFYQFCVHRLSDICNVQFRQEIVKLL